jgi:agmatinase
MEFIRFGALDPQYSDYLRSSGVILPLPYEATTTFLKGTEGGPQALLEASVALEFYDEELDWEPFRAGIHTCDPPALDRTSVEASLAAMEEAASRILAHGKFPLGVGGEHTVTLALVRAARKMRQDLTVIQLDAHADLRDQYEGSPYNHACVMRRVRELCPALQIGIRALDLEEMRLAQQRKWPLVLDLERHGDPLWLDRALSWIQGPVYLTLDLDAMDPALVPGVGTPEPGGFAWYEMLEVLKEIFKRFQVVGADIVELCPRPGLESSAFIAAKLAYKIIGYRFYPGFHQV